MLYSKFLTFSNTHDRVARSMMTKSRSSRAFFSCVQGPSLPTGASWHSNLSPVVKSAGCVALKSTSQGSPVVSCTMMRGWTILGRRYAQNPILIDSDFFGFLWIFFGFFFRNLRNFFGRTLLYSGRVKSLFKSPLGMAQNKLVKDWSKTGQRLVNLDQRTRHWSHANTLALCHNGFRYVSRRCRGC
jgi:hypothetical protein